MFDYDLRTDPDTLESISTEAIDNYIRKHLHSFRIQNESDKGKIWVSEEPQVVAIAKPLLSEYAIDMVRLIEDIAKFKQCTKREVVDELLEKKVIESE
jgi:hypothetical protein